MFRSATVSLLFFIIAATSSIRSEEMTVYVGTYTGGESDGIYSLRFDSRSGAIGGKELVAETTNPSFLALHPNGKYLYAVNETNTGELSAFAIDPRTNKLNFINEKPSGGGAPCHLVVDATGKNLLVANYRGGNVSVTRIQADGSLGDRTAFVQHTGSSVNARRQGEPHAHSISLDPREQFAVVADLGTDELVVYRFDARRGTLTANSKTKLAAGSGPRHFAFHPQGQYAYAINELASTMSVLGYDAKAGRLTEIQSLSTLPDDFSGSSHTAEVRVSTDGRFVYGSNRGHDSIAVYRVDDEGLLSLVQVEPIGGKTPRNFNLDPSGRFLLAAGQRTNTIHVFAVHPTTGKLKRTEHAVSVPSPVCIRFARATRARTADE